MAGGPPAAAPAPAAAPGVQDYTDSDLASTTGTSTFDNDLISEAQNHGNSAQNAIDGIINDTDLGMGDLTAATMNVQQETTLQDLDKGLQDAVKGVVAKMGKALGGN